MYQIKQTKLASVFKNYNLAQIQKYMSEVFLYNVLSICILLQMGGVKILVVQSSLVDRRVSV